jgi:hypothetical protein
VDEVEIDVDEVGRAVFALDDEVISPDLLSESERAIAERALFFGHDCMSFFFSSGPANVELRDEEGRRLGLVAAKKKCKPLEMHAPTIPLVVSSRRALRRAQR